eukprot:scaffold45458_cov64-Phaeocystis_antarctica.AAC.2
MEYTQASSTSKSSSSSPSSPHSSPHSSPFRPSRPARSAAGSAASRALLGTRSLNERRATVSASMRRARETQPRSRRGWKGGRCSACSSVRGEARVEGRGEAVKRPVLECEAVATQVQRRLPRLIAIYISRRGTCRAQHSQWIQAVTRLDPDTQTARAASRAQQRCGQHAARCAEPNLGAQSRHAFAPWSLPHHDTLLRLVRVGRCRVW